MKPLHSRAITNPVLRRKVAFLETSRQSKGHHTAIDMTLAAGGRTPQRCHPHFSTEIVCLVGERSVRTGNRETRLLPGELVLVTARQQQGFVNHSSES